MNNPEQILELVKTILRSHVDNLEFRIGKNRDGVYTGKQIIAGRVKEAQFVLDFIDRLENEAEDE